MRRGIVKTVESLIQVCRCSRTSCELYPAASQFYVSLASFSSLTKTAVGSNAAARLVFGSLKYDYVAPLLYMTCTGGVFTFQLAVYHWQHGLAPLYLADELQRLAKI